MLLLVPPASADGVNVGDPSALRNLIPAADLERQAATQYVQMEQQATSQGALVSATNPETQRLVGIATRILPFTERWNPREKEWKWEINLIRSKQINAFCMPGGKIAFYTGLLDTLQLSDDEVAIVMGHEIAHALREHARARLAKARLTHVGTYLLGAYFGGGTFSSVFSLGGNLLTLAFSRENETEADIVGLDLAARSGFDPHAGVTLWQKMTATNRGAPPQWLSTHPAGANRIQEIEKHLPEVLPLYEQAHADPKSPASKVR